MNATQAAEAPAVVGGATGTDRSPPDVVQSGGDRRSLVRRILAVDELGILLVLLLMVLLIGLFHREFWSQTVLLSTLRQASFVAIAAYGLVFLLAMSELDLSIGSVYAAGIVSCALLMANGLSPWLAALVAIALGSSLGAFNAVLAGAFRVPVIIVTLGTLSLFRGGVIVVSGAKPVAEIPTGSAFFTTLGRSWLGVPVACWFVIVLGIILTVVLRRTSFGFMVRAIGSNKPAAVLSGISATRVRLYALMLSGALVGVAGVLSLAYFRGADPSVGAGFELQVIAAAIIGGNTVSGGSGSLIGALFGALIVAVINSGIVFFQVPTTWTNVVTGAVTVTAVGLDALVRRRRLSRMERAA